MDPASILGALLVSTLKGIAEYKNTRDKMVAAGDVTMADHSVMSNKDLIALFRSDAETLVLNADDLIKKYTLPQGDPHA